MTNEEIREMVERFFKRDVFIESRHYCRNLGNTKPWSAWAGNPGVTYLDDMLCVVVQNDKYTAVTPFDGGEREFESLEAAEAFLFEVACQEGVL